MRHQITLTGEQAEQFGRIKQELTESFGHEPTNARVVAFMMAGFDSEQVADALGGRGLQ